jgi:DNA-binding transcriptional ArsR family regulator
MSEPDDALALDRLIHEPNRLAILTILSTSQDADFVFLQRALKLNNGNLSSHLTKREAGGLIELEKSFVGKKPNTRVALTAGSETGQHPLGTTRPPQAPLGATRPAG